MVRALIQRPPLPHTASVTRSQLVKEHPRPRENDLSCISQPRVTVSTTFLLSYLQTVMLLSLVLADKEQHQQRESEQNRTDELAPAAATGGNDEPLTSVGAVEANDPASLATPIKKLLGNTHREQQEPASRVGQPATSDAHEAKGKGPGRGNDRGNRRKRQAPTPAPASSDHEALSAKRRRTRSGAAAASGASKQCRHDDRNAGAGVECRGIAGDDDILRVGEASSSEGEGGGLDERDGDSDDSESDYTPASAVSEVCVFQFSAFPHVRAIW